MTNATGKTHRNGRFLNALVEELRTMSDTDALEGEKPEELVKLGERLLKNAREQAGRRRMADAKRKLSAVSERRIEAAPPSVAEARRYLEQHPDLTLAARDLNELSDADLLALFSQATSLEELSNDRSEDCDE